MVTNNEPKSVKSGRKLTNIGKGLGSGNTTVAGDRPSGWPSFDRGWPKSTASASM